jgi:hypothetical protein
MQQLVLHNQCYLLAGFFFKAKPISRWFGYCFTPTDTEAY